MVDGQHSGTISGPSSRQGTASSSSRRPSRGTSSCSRCSYDSPVGNQIVHLGPPGHVQGHWRQRAHDLTTIDQDDGHRPPGSQHSARIALVPSTHTPMSSPRSTIAAWRRAQGDAVQDIRFARSADGVGIAYAVHGSGPPLLIDACWLSHLQFDWQSPVWRHYLVELGRIATVIRYDERGHGLSDRGVTDHSLAGPGRRSRGGRRRRRVGPLRPAGHGPGRTGGDRVRRAAPGAAHPAGLLRQLRRGAGRRPRRRSSSSMRRSRR